MVTLWGMAKSSPWLEVLFGTRWEKFTTGQLNQLIQLGEGIMAQIDDLRALVSSIGDKVDGVDTALDGVRAGISGVADEVRALIDRLGQGSPDLGQAIADLGGIANRLDAVNTEVGEASDALKAIPPAP